MSGLETLTAMVNNIKPTTPQQKSLKKGLLILLEFVQQRNLPVPEGIKSTTLKVVLPKLRWAATVGDANAVAYWLACADLYTARELRRLV